MYQIVDSVNTGEGNDLRTECEISSSCSIFSISGRIRKKRENNQRLFERVNNCVNKLHLKVLAKAVLMSNGFPRNTEIQIK